MASDNKIIELIKQGDIAAFNTLFKSVYLQLYIHCRKFIPDPEDAKDILYSHVFKRLFIQGYTERMPQLPSFYRNSLSD